MQNAIIFDPLLSWPVFAALVLGAVAVLFFAMWRRLFGGRLRFAAALVLLVALAKPAFQVENRETLPDMVFLAIDRTASQTISDRATQVDQTVQAMRARIERLPNTELKIVDLADDPDDGGTLLMGALNEAMASVPRNQIAGTIVISDGQIHDNEQTPEMPAPLHFLQTGHSTDWDRRLVVKNSPGFGILGETLSLTIHLDDQGQIPEGLPPFTDLVMTLDGGAPQVFNVPIGQDVTLPLSLEHGGINVVQLEIAAQSGELTDRNNAAVVQVNGVRDRLSVLLVSGEPYPGERTWRNLLKSDSSVDLVHFTILRPPQKQDQAPVSELALIAFPTRELFLDKIQDFDLIIFDRYRRRGILPATYLENVRQYVENGGAVLVAAGPGYASADSLYRSPLGDIIPGAPTSRVLEIGFQPKVSDLGQRHPVTAGLSQGGTGADDELDWGRWFRLVDVDAVAGDTLMSGPENRPLLVLDRVGEGRVALIASDHAWLWGRGFEGGGPQQELLRRLAHWMMKEPELEEESLRAIATGQAMQITRQTLDETVGEVEVTGPDGTTVLLPLEAFGPGSFATTFDAPEIGLYRLKEGDQATVVAVGPSAPKEFVETIATPEKIKPAVSATRGGIVQIEDGLPDLRVVRSGRVAAGRGWIGLTQRNAYLTTDVRLTTLLPPWLALLLAASLSVAAWLREGRR